MQAIPATGSPFAEQVLDCMTMAGVPAGVQIVEPDAAAGKPSFTKLLLRGLSMEAADGSGAESSIESLGEDTAADEDAPAQDVALLNGLALCYFVPVKLTSQPAEAGTAAAEAAAPETGLLDSQLPDLPDQAPAQESQQPVESLQEDVAAEPDKTQPAETFGRQIPAQEPQAGVPQHLEANPDKKPGIQSRDSEQHASGNPVQESQKAAPGDVAEKVTSLLRSMSDESSKEEPFNRLLSREKEPPYNEAAENQGISGMQPQLNHVSERGAAAAEKSVAVERALNSFLEDLRSTESGGREIRIVLEPESLGELRISVTSTEKGIVAKIKSEDREICAIISDQIQKLVQSMENKGITVENVDVLFEQAGRDMNSGKSLGGDAERHPNRGYKDENNIDSVDGQGIYAWKGILDAAAEDDGALEYRV
ncbi:MAG: flagellar hook-length control protein FliK [Oscillospiraceae bacterium]|jgi:flagellar hook-length control protein FliK